MQQVRDVAIVLRSVTFEERSRIVTALTEQHGVISALARNAIQSRRFGGALDAFTAADWMYVEKPGSDLHRLEEAAVRRSFEGLRKDFERLSLASVFNELVARIAPKEEPCPDLFRLHSNALAFLDEAPLVPRDDPRSVVDLALLNGYLVKILQWHGSQPQIQACMGCQVSIDGVDPRAHVSCVVSDAGWLCPACRSVETRHVRERGETQAFAHSLLRLSPASIRDFQMMMNLPIRQIPAIAQSSRGEHRDLFRFLEALFIYHVPGFDQRPLRSLRFLDVESSVAASAPGLVQQAGRKAVSPAFGS